MASIKTSASSPKLNTRISQELKAKILQEALLPNSSIPKIAKHYNLSPKSIYNWRNHYHKSIPKSLSATSVTSAANSSNPTHNVPTKPSVSTQGNFVELITKPSISKSSSPLNKTQDSSPRSSCSGSKISLSFSNFSLSLTGNFSPVTLIRIINILGESC